MRGIGTGDTEGRRRVTRRDVIRSGAIAAGGAAVAASPASASPAPRRLTSGKTRARRYDVAVVGAGLSGLTAARDLVAAGRSVVVLESRDRVGGRIWNHPLSNGEISERGGTFAGPTQTQILSLASTLGVDTFDTYDTGDIVYVADGARSTYSDTGITGTAPDDPEILLPLATVVQNLDTMSKTVPVAAPWSAPNAATWDSQTLATWIQQQPTVDARFENVTAIATRVLFGCEPRDISLLKALVSIASFGDESTPGTFERGFDTRAGAQQWRFVGGSQLIAIKLAAQLGTVVQLGTPVRSITQSPSSVQVVSDKLTVTAKEVIVATPPHLAAMIQCVPHLPVPRDQLTQRLASGVMTKVAATYGTPFWREAGLSGTGISTDGPVCAVFDDSPPSATPGVLFGFIGGDQQRAFSRLSPAAQQAAVLTQFAGFFGAQASSPTAFFQTDWASDPWSRGYAPALAGPGLLLEYGPAISQPVDRIHWAGTETASYWAGYMDGAVRAGHRAAAEVLASL